MCHPESRTFLSCRDVLNTFFVYVLLICNPKTMQVMPGIINVSNESDREKCYCVSFIQKTRKILWKNMGEHEMVDLELSSSCTQDFLHDSFGEMVFYKRTKSYIGTNLKQTMSWRWLSEFQVEDATRTWFNVKIIYVLWIDQVSETFHNHET